MPSLLHRFAVGTIVAGRYRIEGLLGEGGSGAVFRATQLNLDRPVALKAFLPERFGDDGIERFRREAGIVQRLEHPNVIKLLDFGVAAGAEPFLVFELLSGQTLEAALRDGPMPAARVARIASQILKALMEAHARGVVHRDVKPANVFLCSFEGAPDFVKLIDFGIARAADGTLDAAKGTLVGTPAYMAPEQATGGAVTPLADLFALGLTMEEALTGKPVFAGASVVAIVREHVASPVVPHTPGALDPPLGPVIHRATQKAPERRHPSAAEMLAHVEAAMTFADAASREVSSRRSPEAAPTSALPLALPTALPTARPPAPLPASPPASPAVVRRSSPPAAWTVAIAMIGVALLLGTALALVVTLTQAPRSARGAASASASSSAATAGERSARAELALDRFGTNAPSRAAEAHVNADGIPDLVAVCAAVERDAPPELCAVDGASFTLLWRRPAPSETLMFASAGASIVAVDPGGVAHVLDAATGTERAALRLGGHADWLGTAPDGKVWLRTKQPRGLLLDAAAMTLADAPRPAACVRGLGERDCFDNVEPFLCPPVFSELDAPDVFVRDRLIDDTRGVARGAAKADRTRPVVLGFEPVFEKAAWHRKRSRVLWQQNLVTQSEPAASVSFVTDHVAFAGGRLVTGYELASGAVHVVALDAATGRRLWDVESKPFDDIALSSTRVYVTRTFTRVDVRDAATGALLGGFGKEFEGRLPRAIEHQ